MYFGELKLNVNSQLQLNNDLFVSKNIKVDNFDAILKNKTVDHSEVDRRLSYKISKDTPSNEGVGKQFGKKMPVHDRESINELRQMIKDEIAQRKFQKENGTSDDDPVAKFDALKEKLKVLNEKIKKQLEITGDEEGLEELAQLLGVELEVLIEAIVPTGTEEIPEEVSDQIVEMLINEEIDVEKFIERLETKIDKLPENKAELFEALLNDIIEKLPEGDIKEEFIALSEKIQSTELSIETMEAIPDEVVASEIVKEVETEPVENKNSEGKPVETNAVEKQVDEIKVEVKSEETKQEQESKEQPKEVKVLKSNVPVKEQLSVEDQLIMMKQDTAVISSAKVTPREALSRSVVNQVVQGMKMSVNLSDQGSEILIKLNPKNLGNVSLKMAFDKGTLMAEIQVENQTVKGIIESNINDLRSALKQEGYVLGELDVSVNKENTGEQNRGFSQAFKGKKHETFEEVEERVINERNLVTDKEVDYLA